MPVSSQLHISAVRKLSCHGVVLGENICYGKRSRNLSPSRGPAAGWELHHGSPALLGPEEGARITRTRSQGQKLFFTSLMEGAEQPPHGVFVAKGAVPLKQSNLSTSNPKYLLGGVSVQTHNSDLFPPVLASWDEGCVP